MDPQNPPTAANFIELYNVLSSPEKFDDVDVEFLSEKLAVLRDWSKLLQDVVHGLELLTLDKAGVPEHLRNSPAHLAEWDCPTLRPHES